jgi:uncharacterized membrane protein
MVDEGIGWVLVLARTKPATAANAAHARRSGGDVDGMVVQTCSNFHSAFSSFQ